jgi:tartrate dehydrogenase/decarboxylase / D-malate dehydrogenase
MAENEFRVYVRHRRTITRARYPIRGRVVNPRKRKKATAAPVAYDGGRCAGAPGGLGLKTFQIAVIAGDGIGKEVVPEGIRALNAAAQRYGFNLEWHPFDWSCETYLKTGAMMPADGLDQVRRYDAIFLGAVGRPDVPDHVSLWGLLIPIRRSFQQYVNLRPVKLLEGIESPLKNWKRGDIDFTIVRENNEGEYSNIGGRIYEGTDDETAVQQAVFTRRGVDRILRYAFELARKRRKHLTSATKSNGIIHTMPFWDERFRAMSSEYADVRTDQYHIDILTAHFVRHPDWFDVVVGSNLFGDILSDLGPAVVGSIGIAASANLNPEKNFPSMFEPVHGSAPDIYGKGIANPIGQIWSGAMMLRHFGVEEAANAVEAAIASTLARGKVRTPDIGGQSSTEELGAAIAEAVSERAATVK